MSDLERKKLDILLSGFEEYEGKEIVLYGCGNTTELYRKGFERDAIPISFFVDRRAYEMNGLYDGLKVIHPDLLSEYYSNNMRIFIMSDSQKTTVDIISDLSQKGYYAEKIDNYYFKKNKEQILKVYDMLEDEKSKMIYACLIMKRMENQQIEEDIYTEKQYFGIKEFRQSGENEVFVDIGAFVGDSLEKYIWERMGVFKKIYAFEPAPANFNAMRNRVERLKNEWGISEKRIEIVPAGIGKEKGSLVIEDVNDSTLGSRLDKNTDGKKIPVYSIDSYFENQKISFLKADIESYEYDMLLGAKKVVKRDRPKLAICIYHNAIDFTTIPLLIKEIEPSYKFAIRHHTFLYSDTVIYAY